MRGGPSESCSNGSTVCYLLLLLYEPVIFILFTSVSLDYPPPLSLSRAVRLPRAVYAARLFRGPICALCALKSSLDLCCHSLVRLITFEERGGGVGMQIYIHEVAAVLSFSFKIDHFLRFVTTISYSYCCTNCGFIVVPEHLYVRLPAFSFRVGLLVLQVC